MCSRCWGTAAPHGAFLVYRPTLVLAGPSGSNAVRGVDGELWEETPVDPDHRSCEGCMAGVVGVDAIDCQLTGVPVDGGAHGVGGGQAELGGPLVHHLPYKTETWPNAE